MKIAGGINGWPNEISINHSYDATTTIVSKVMIVNKLGPKKHGFKNRTGPAGSTGSTGDRYLIRSGFL